MKRFLLPGVVMLLICGAAYTSYLLGYREGFGHALVLQNGTFVGTFDALQKLRAGDVEGGTRRIETLCFSAANTVYSARPAARFVAKTFVQDFRNYRQTYRSNRVDWTVAEQNLEGKLANWK
jgi:hypothetical protein